MLNATQQLISARRDYAQAIYTYAINVLKLKAAAGTLSDGDSRLREPVAGKVAAGLPFPRLRCAGDSSLRATRCRRRPGSN